MFGFVKKVAKTFKKNNDIILSTYHKNKFKYNLNPSIILQYKYVYRIFALTIKRIKL